MSIQSPISPAHSAVPADAPDYEEWPSGAFWSLDRGATHQVKRIRVKPRGQLSLRNIAVGGKKDTRQWSNAVNIDRETLGSGWQGHCFPAQRPTPNAQRGKSNRSCISATSTMQTMYSRQMPANILSSVMAFVLAGTTGKVYAAKSRARVKLGQFPEVLGGGGRCKRVFTQRPAQLQTIEAQDTLQVYKPNRFCEEGA